MSQKPLLKRARTEKPSDDLSLHGKTIDTVKEFVEEYGECGWEWLPEQKGFRTINVAGDTLTWLPARRVAPLTPPTTTTTIECCKTAIDQLETLKEVADIQKHLESHEKVLENRSNLKIVTKLIKTHCDKVTDGKHTFLPQNVKLVAKKSKRGSSRAYYEVGEHTALNLNSFVDDNDGDDQLKVEFVGTIDGIEGAGIYTL